MTAEYRRGVAQQASCLEILGQFPTGLANGVARGVALIAVLRIMPEERPIVQGGAVLSLQRR